MPVWVWELLALFLLIAVAKQSGNDEIFVVSLFPLIFLSKKPLAFRNKSIQEGWKHK